MDYISMLGKAVTGAFMGLGWGLVGYFSKQDECEERPKFEPKKLGVAIGLGAVIGAYSGVTGMPFADVLDSAFVLFGQYGPIAGTVLGGGVIAMIEKGFKAVYRSIKRAV